MSKVSKASVHYSRGMKTAHCGICQHFEPPHSCKVVEGHIDPDMWCERFSKASARTLAARKMYDRRPGA